jgi:YesN/AraC family two-component response regulator
MRERIYPNSTFLKDLRKLGYPDPLTILLVEDEQSIRHWLHTELEALGCNLLEATDGRDAVLIAELHDGPIDIVVTDIVMPRLDGLDLVKALHKFRPGLPALYMSGFPSPFLRDNLRLPKTIKLLAKPFPISDLLDEILKTLAATAQPGPASLL